MFDRELDYYGITNGGTGTITEVSFAATMHSLVRAKVKHDMFFLALECSSQFGQNYSGALPSVNVVIDGNHKLFKRGSYLNSEEQKLFEEYLGKHFGLKIVGSGHKPNRCGISFSVGPKDDVTIGQSSLAKTMHSLIQDKMKQDMLFLALECSSQFGQKCSGSSVSVTIGKDHKLYNGDRLDANSLGLVLFKSYLERFFGLKVDSGNPNRCGTPFKVGPKN